MQDLLRDRVVQAVAQADAQRDSGIMFADGQQALPQSPRLLEIADIELVIERHRVRAQDAGYRLGVEHGRARGVVEHADVLTHRLGAAATQLIGALNVVIDEASAALEQDGVKRATMRRQVEKALAGVVSVRGTLSELSSLVNAT